MGERREGRVLAFQTLYRYELTAQSPEDLLDFSWLDETHVRRLGGTGEQFARLLIAGVLENLERVDNEIRTQLEHWDFERVHRVDLSVLRLSAYCLLYQETIPPSVTIDEAVEIARIFGTDESHRFVNGVLDGMRRRVCEVT